MNAYQEQYERYKSARLRMEMAGIEFQLRLAERRKEEAARQAENARREAAQFRVAPSLGPTGRKIEDIKRQVVQGRTLDGRPMMPADLDGHSRRSAVNKARQLAMWRAKRETGWSLPRIGRHFGNRDHTTILHAVRQVEKKGVEHFEVPA